MERSTVRIGFYVSDFKEKGKMKVNLYMGV